MDDYAKTNVGKIKLYPYQVELIQKIKDSIHKKHKHIVAVLGCGGGKSIIQAAIAKSATDKGNRVLFLVHRKELVAQIKKTFYDMGVDFNLCTFGMVQTVAKRLKTTAAPILILQDEAHHALAKNYRKIYEFFSDAFLLGFTATPQRMKEGGLGSVFSDLIESVSTEWLIQNHYLSPYEYYGMPLVDTSHLHVKRGEFDSGEVELLMNSNKIYGDTIKNWKEKANGKKTIIYCSSIKTSQAQAEAFQNQGITAAHLDGTTPATERDETVKAFRKGEIQVLCNVDLFGEGFDVPDCECVVLLRPTRSLTVFVQQSMRSMRYMPGKTAIIIDHVQNHIRFGLPDSKREWTLKEKKKKENNEVFAKTCPNCFQVVPATVKTCPGCGYEFESQKKERELVDVNLVRITCPSRWELCGTWDQLEAFRKSHKYKFLWSIHKAMEMGISIPREYKWLQYKYGGAN